MGRDMARKQSRHTHNGVSFDLMPRDSKGGPVWYIGVIDSTGKKRYSTIRSTKQSVKARALEIAVSIVEDVAREPMHRVRITRFIDEMWTDGSDFLTTRSRNRKTGKRIGALHAHNSRGWLVRHFVPWCKREDITYVDELTPAMLTRWMTELATNGRITPDTKPLAIASVEKVRKCLNVTLVHAAKLGYIDQNPLHGIDAGEVGPDEVERTEAKREHIPLPWCQMILQAKHWAEHWALTMAYLSYLTGAREGELRALTWGAVDLTSGVITITASWDNHTRQSKAPKSRKGYRSLPIDSVAVAYLRKLQEHAQWADEDDIIFVKDRRGVPISPGRGLYHLRQAAKRAGVPLDNGKHSFHSLRHTYATYTEGSLSSDDRMAALGHSDMSVTDGYTHESEERIERLRRLQRDKFTIVQAV